MSIPVVCDECGANFQVKDELAGKKLRCKHCSAVMPVPSGGEEDWDLAADEDEELPPTVRPKKSKTRSRRSSSSSGMPAPIIIAVVCLVLMIGFTLLNMMGNAAIGAGQPNAAAIRAGAMMGDIVRLLIQIVVTVGVVRGSRGTRVPAMVLAVLFCVVIGLAGLVTASRDPNGMFILLALGFAVIVRIIFIACLAVSADYFED